VATPAISAGSFPEWMYPVPVLGGPLLAVLAGLVEVAAAEDHLGAEGLHRFDLHRVGLLGHADHRPQAEQTRRIRHRLAMITGRSGDNTPAPLAGAQLADQVHAAADFEGANRLMILVLDPHLGPGHGIQRRIAIQRSHRQVGRDALTRREDLSKIGHREGSHATCLPPHTRCDEAAGGQRCGSGGFTLPSDHAATGPLAPRPARARHAGIRGTATCG